MRAGLRNEGQDFQPCKDGLYARSRLRSHSVDAPRKAKIRVKVATNEFASKPMSAEQCAANASIQESAAQDADYRIQPGDQLALDFYMNSEFNDTTTVDPNGKDRTADGWSNTGRWSDTGFSWPPQSTMRISNELRNPGAVVHLERMPNRQIYVEGEVAKPGAFPLQPGMTAVQALALAGGVTVNSERRARRS